MSWIVWEGTLKPAYSLVFMVSAGFKSSALIITLSKTLTCVQTKMKLTTWNQKLKSLKTLLRRKTGKWKHKYSLLEKSVQELQAEFSRLGETVKIAIEDSTQAVFASMNFEQKEHEKRIGSQFDQLNEQINILCNALKSSSITTHPPLLSNFTSSPPTPGNQTRLHQTQTNAANS